MWGEREDGGGERGHLSLAPLDKSATGNFKTDYEEVYYKFYHRILHVVTVCA